MRSFVLGLLLVACTQGAPPGFSGGVGDRWSLPLVGPLEGGPLVTAVTLNTNGPFLFAIDPDAPMSIVDGELVKKLNLRTFGGPKRLDESDTQQTRSYAEVLNLEIGSLIVERRDVVIVRPGSYDAGGRRIWGVIGRDILADSLVWGFDRDQGVVNVVEQKKFKPAADAKTLGYSELRPRISNAQVVPPYRRLVDVMINGQKFTMHVDLGAAPSQLRDNQWDKAKLVPREVKSAVIDEVGSIRGIDKASEPTQVTVGGITADGVVFIPYGDKRWDAEDISGTIGLGVFANLTVYQSWDAKQYYLSPRKDVPVATRINRWDNPVFAKCKAVGCVTIRVIDPLNGQPPPEGKPHPGLVMSITREDVAGGMALEVTLEATGTPTANTLPRLLVNMPGHVDKLLYQLPPTFLGTSVGVVDASPFPRDCPTPNGCIDQMAR